MTASKFIKAIALAFSITGIVACGGGGGDNVAGIGGTGITASGTITGFGSIFVNGIRFDVETASVSGDDDVLTKDNLQLGMVVKVKGELDSTGLNGIASSVEYDDVVQGPISNPVDLDNVAVKLEVLGITVIADKIATSYVGINFSSLVTSSGEYIEVSGFFDNAGELQATRIELKSPSLAIEVKGTAAYPVAGNMTLDIENSALAPVTVDLSNVVIPAGLDGAYVEVVGTLIDPTTIEANEIEFEDTLFADDEELVSLEGIITQYANNDSFFVAGQEVNAAGAVFDPANATLAAGMEVEVEGPRSGGVIYAQEVEVESAEIKIEAPVTSTSVPNNLITLIYTGDILPIYVDVKTQYEDDHLSLEPFALSDINDGDNLQISGRLDDSGNVIANEIKRVSAQPTSEDELLEGPVDSCIAGGNITILGIPFLLDDTGPVTTEFQDQFENPIDNSTDFCVAWAASPELHVKVVDTAASDGIADEAELED